MKFLHNKKLVVLGAVSAVSLLCLGVFVVAAGVTLAHRVNQPPVGRAFENSINFNREDRNIGQVKGMVGNGFYMVEGQVSAVNSSEFVVDGTNGTTTVTWDDNTEITKLASTDKASAAKVGNTVLVRYSDNTSVHKAIVVSVIPEDFTQDEPALGMGQDRPVTRGMMGDNMPRGSRNRVLVGKITAATGDSITVMPTNSSDQVQVDIANSTFNTVQAAKITEITANTKVQVRGAKADSKVLARSIVIE